LFLLFFSFQLSLDTIFREVEKCFHFKSGGPHLFENDSTDSEENEDPVSDGFGFIESDSNDSEEYEEVELRSEGHDLFENDSEGYQSMSGGHEEEAQSEAGGRHLFHCADSGQEESIFNFYDPRIDTCTGKRKTNICLPQHKVASHKAYKKAMYVKTPKGARYMCPFCKRKFKSWGSGNGHVSKRHGGSKKKCEFCVYTTWNPDAFRKHMKKHAGLGSSTSKQQQGKNAKRQTI